MSTESNTDSTTSGLPRRDFMRFTALGFGGAAVFALTGCGMNSGGGDSKKSGTSTLKAAFERPIISLDPHGPSDVDEGTLLACRHIFDTLVVRDGENIAPSVATKWEQTDPKTWVLHLRDDVKYHDGSALTANDVKASLERVAKSDTRKLPCGPRCPRSKRLMTTR